MRSVTDGQGCITLFLSVSLSVSVSFSVFSVLCGDVEL